MKTGYKNLSKDEVYLLSRAQYEGLGTITTAYVKEIFKDLEKAWKVLNRLTKKGRLLKLKKGLYMIVPLEAPNQQWIPNEFIAAKKWIGDVPYYLGYFTAYNFWGFTEQVPQTIYILNTKRSGRKSLGPLQFKAVKIIESKYYGITEIEIEGESVCVSDKERTIVDLFSKPIGSMATVRQVVLDNLDSLNLGKLIGYLILFPSVNVRKRAGYILETLNVSKSKLKALKKTIKDNTGVIGLDPLSTSRKGTVCKEWGLVING